MVFGLFWSADAYMKWALIFQGIDYADLISHGVEGQPANVAQWISFWSSTAKTVPGFSYIIAILETIVAGFILAGFLTNLTASFGMVLSFLIWSTAEAFGGIFTTGATDIGTSPLYMAMFAGLIVVQAGRQRGIDSWIIKRHPRLRVFV